MRLGEAPDGWRTGRHELDGGPYERVGGVQASRDGKARARTTPSQVRTSMCVVWCSSAHGDVAPRPKRIQFLSDISALMWVGRRWIGGGSGALISFVRSLRSRSRRFLVPAHTHSVFFLVFCFLCIGDFLTVRMKQLYIYTTPAARSHLIKSVLMST